MTQSVLPVLLDPLGADWRKFPSLVQLTQWRAQVQSDETAFTFLVDGEQHEENISFAELDRLASIVAAGLRQHGEPGDRVLVLQEPGINYIVSLFGCLYAGLVAVPVYPPELLRLQATLPRLQAITSSAGAAILLSSRQLIDGGLGSQWSADCRAILAIEDICLVSTASDVKQSIELPEFAVGSSVAILQYTSGSTGTPRGVALTHECLLANLAAAYDTWDVPSAVAVHWLPPYHDMGLIGGILLPVYGGRRVVLMAPQTFLQRPFRLLQAFDHYRGTSTGTPNFGLELCVRKVTDAECEGLDLSSWKVAVVGAEPVRASTVKRFSERFARYGFSSDAICPAYGMAESTVVITGKPKYRPPLYCVFDANAMRENRAVACDALDSSIERIELVGCGPPVPTTEVKVVNPETLQEVAVGEVGELWVRGPSVAAGYWNEPEVSQAVFQASLKGQSQQNFLRTGDLGFEFQDQVFVNGRLKELLIIAGKNYYPNDIEKAVQLTSDAFRVDHGAALSIDIDDEERLVFIQEITRPKKWNFDDLVRLILLAIAENFGLRPHAVVLVTSGSLPKTSSGKLRRRECRSLFLQNELRVLHQWTADEEFAAAQNRTCSLPETNSERILAEIWQNVLDIETVYRDDSFLHLGGHSLTVTQLLQQVNSRFAIELPLAFLFDHPTLRQFAAALDLELKSASEGAQRLTSKVATIAPMQPAESYPLSHAQQRFWLLNQLGKTGAFSQIAITVHCPGELDRQRMQMAIDGLMSHHRSLQTCFLDQHGQVQQYVRGSSRAILEFLDARHQSEQAATDQLANFHSSLRQPFDLRVAPLVRFGLVHLNECKSQLTLVLHHMICDGWSLHILLQNLADLYNEPNALRKQSLTDRRLEYTDFVAWERSSETQLLFSSRLPYWRDRLTGAPVSLELPLDHPREQGPAVPSETVACTIDSALKQRISLLAEKQQTTLFVVHLAAWQFVLSTYLRSSDVVVGVPSANRQVLGIDAIVGCFINTVPMRGNIKAEESFSDLLQRTRTKVMADLQAGDIPFDRLLEVVDISRQNNRLPLVQHLFLYQPPMTGSLRLGENQVTAIESDYTSLSDFDLTLVVEQHEQCDIKLVYSPALFETATVQRILDNYLHVLQQISVDATLRLEELQVPCIDEMRWLRANGRGAPLADVSFDHCSLLGESYTDRAAIIDRDGSITYSQLLDSANRLAHWLTARGVKPGDLVGICLSRTRRMIISTLAIWKVGAAYVPLDPLYPVARIEAMWRDSGLKVVLTESSLASIFPESELRVCLLDQLEEEIDRLSTRTVQRQTSGDELAYLIYTSGSTGKPKGVMVPHRALANLLQSFAHDPGFSATDRLLALTTMSFDISILELCLPLVVGGQVVIADSRVAEEPQRVFELIDAHAVTVVQGTPSTFRMLLSTGWQPQSTLTIYCGGEPLPNDLAKQLRRNGALLHNVYGPTETTVWSTTHKVTSDTGAVPIGKPIAETLVAVVDNNQQLVPRGVAGELWIGGLGVTLGYWNRPDLTSARFVKRAFEERIEPIVYYRTGDLVRWSNDGTLQFLSRVDRQIKLRGHRIELGEIEAILERQNSIHEAAVVKCGDGTAAILVAYCALSQGAEPNSTSVIASLRRDLPEYMIPQQIVFCATLPHTPAGKIDYQALAATEIKLPAREFTPPRTELESELAELWCEVLQVAPIGVHDNFFELGGHSLKAAQLFARLRDRLVIELPLRELYDSPTIALLGERIVTLRLEDASEQQLEELLSELEKLPDTEAGKL